VCVIGTYESVNKMRTSTLFGYLVLSQLGACVSVQNTKVFEEVFSAPEGWTAVGEPSPDAQLDFRIALQAVSVFVHFM
jgi:hypothetical protein